MLLRKLLGEFRAKREYLRSIGFMLFRHVNPKDVRVATANEDGIKALETFLSSGDFAKHRKRLENQREGLVEYLIAWHLVLTDSS